MPLTFVRPNIAAMEGYTPGEQPAPNERVVKLNTNENPYPPSPRVMQAIAAIQPDALRRYPNPTADAFRDAAAKVLGVARDMILAGNGSDDVLNIATRTFVAPGGVLAYPDPTYSLYPVLAGIEEARVAPVPWEDNWSLPVEGLLRTRPNAIYLANPNAPSGTFVAPEIIARLARSFDGLLLIDEAYVDFADANCLQLARECPNVVVTRTFSKAYSLAGLRFGFAVARPPVIAEMMKVKDSYNCDALAIAAATAAIGDQDYAAHNWRQVRAERSRVSAELTALGFDVLPSQANFLLAGVPGNEARALYQGLKKQGILIRFFDKPGLSDKIRITIGTRDENEALLAGMRSLLPQRPSR